MKTKALCIAFFLLLGSAVHADCNNLALAYLFGYGGGHQTYGVVNNFTPPYFALHPPVYYGQRFARPYGESPYASWPQLQPNPHYAPRLVADSIGPKPRTIANPYFVPSPAPVFPSAPAPQAYPVQPPVQPHIEPNQLPALELPTAPNAPTLPAPSGDKKPDVVRKGPLSIENPYFVESSPRLVNK
jgi:hypothetical protein